MHRSYTGNASRNNVPSKRLLSVTFLCAVLGTLRSRFCILGTVCDVPDIKSKLRAIIVLALLWAIVVVVDPVVDNNQGSNSSFSKDRIEISICKIFLLCTFDISAGGETARLHLRDRRMGEEGVVGVRCMCFVICLTHKCPAK